VGNKVLRSIYLDVAQVERIKRLSDITKVPQAVYVREGLDLLLRKYEEKMGSDARQYATEEQA
jgi:predicted DNA-binding protein